MIFSSLYFDLAKRNLELHFLRSALAIIGIIIGVLAITTMGILGASLQASVSNELSDSVNTITISPSPGSSNDPDRITAQQLKQIQISAGQNDVIPLNSGFDSITVGSKEGFASIYGLKPYQFPGLLELEEGKFVKSSEGVVVGREFADTYDLTIGSRITIGFDEHAKKVRIIGIVKNSGFTGVVSTDNAVIASDKWYFSTYGGDNEYSSVIVQIADVKNIDAVKDSIGKRLNQRKDVVSIYDSRAFLDVVNSAIGMVSLFVMAIGGISLIVAAVSIFNVMLMSVNERVKEIGILRSIGTQKPEIRKIFLYEALILGVVGSVIGVLLSLLISALILYLVMGGAQYLLEPSTLMYVPFGILIGTGISLLSGVYPAKRAAGLNPIVALSAE